MLSKTISDRKKTYAAALRMTAYLLAVILVFSAISILCAADTIVVPAAEPGVTDLTDFDFGSAVAVVATESTDSVFMYPGAFYTPEDFASGSVMQGGVLYSREPGGLGDYGTLFLELKLPPGEAYAVAGRSVSYAQRLFINGKEYPPIGRPGTGSGAVVPKSMRYMEGFSAPGGTARIVIHYSAFVHADGGGLYPLSLGLPRNVARVEQLRAFRIAAVTFALIAAMLFFFGIFLFFGKSRYFLWFSLACGCIALRGLLTGEKAIMLLLPNLDWYAAIRLEYLTTCGVALFSALYLNALFPRAANKWVMLSYTVLCALNAVCICLTPPFLFTRYVTVMIWSYILFNAWLLLAILVSALYKKRAAALSGGEQVLLLAGFLIYLLLSALGVRAHMGNNYLWGVDYPEVGMMSFLFLNILALALGFSRTERELDETRRSEREALEINRMLERLDKLRADFLANITHEMKTPLTVMSGYAQLAVWQIDEGKIGPDTRENLLAIMYESRRLAELSSGLLRVSAETAWERGPVSVPSITGRAVAACRPITAKSGNRLETKLDDGLPSVCVNGDMIQQVLLNLIINANKHTLNGVITLTGAMEGGNPESGFVSISVSDNGQGIDPKLLPHIFDRHVSGDGGNGLGLSICREIVETHGGRIAIKGTPGVGTRVAFTLPVEKEWVQDEANHPDD